MSREYRFIIDAYSPETIPMARLAEYLTDLANLMGHKKAVHFSRLEEGSVQVVHVVDHEDIPKVERRLRGANQGEGPPEALSAIRSIDAKLADDNAIGRLLGQQSAEIINFRGREIPKPLEYGSFREHATIQGQLVRIGGRDITSHAMIQDGDIHYSNCEMSREMARDLSPLLYGPTVRLHGSGLWKRTVEGDWDLKNYKVDSFEILDDKSLSEAVSELRSMLPKRRTSKDIDRMKKLRSDGSESG